MILAVLQARVSSQRLPEKVLKSILGKPMLAQQIQRVSQSKKIDKLVIATSVEGSDDRIETLAGDLNIDYYRGSLDDVLERFYRAAEKYKPEWVLRLTGDCPLIDAEVIDQVISFAIEGDFDYASNTLEPTFPDGLDVEVFKFLSLARAEREASLPSERQHVTPYIYKNPKLFKLGSFKSEENNSHLRWTVDEKEDFEFVQEVYGKLYVKNSNFKMRDILTLLKLEPSLSKINAKFIRNEGYAQTLKDEKGKR